MSQMIFSDFEYASQRKQIHRERFLGETDEVAPHRKFSSIKLPTMASSQTGFPDFE